MKVCVCVSESLCVCGYVCGYVCVSVCVWCCILALGVPMVVSA